MSEEKEKTEEKTESTDLIKELGLLATGSSFKSDYQYINIIGCIEGHTTLPSDNKTTKYEHLIPQLVMVEENPEVKGLLLILNTVGGDVEAGLALAELIASLFQTDGNAGDRRRSQHRHSVGRILKLFLCCKDGDHDHAPDQNQRNTDYGRRNFRIYAKNPGESSRLYRRALQRVKEDVEAKMNQTGNMSNDVGTVLFGPDAVEMGLVNEIGGLR